MHHPLAVGDRLRACEALNELIRGCQADAVLLEVAATVVDDPSERARILEMSRRRTGFVGELSEAIRGLGGTPVRAGSLLARARTLLLRVRAVAMGVREQEAYGVCAGALAATESEYADTLAAGLPESGASVVARQHLEITRDRAGLRRLWMLV